MYNTAVYRVRWPSLTTIILAVLLVSLIGSCILVVRLIDRVSATELQERREALQAGMFGFRAALAGSLFRAISESHPGPSALFLNTSLREDLAEEFMRNAKRAGDSHLVSGLALGTKAEGGEIRFEQFDTVKRAFRDVPWPDDISTLKAALGPADEGPNGDRRPTFAFLLAGERPMIALPLIQREPSFRQSDRRMRLGPWAGQFQRRLPETGGREAEPQAGAERPRVWGWGQPEPGERVFREFRTGPPFPPPGDLPQNAPGFPGGLGPGRASPRLVGWCFLFLDYEKLKNEVLPQLIDRHFRGREREFGLAVISPPGMKLVVQGGAPVNFDGESNVDGALSLIERRPPLPDPRVSSAPGAPQMEVVESGPLGRLLHSQPNGWMLVARHRDGSLESVVASKRHRWIAGALAMFTLLAGFATVLVWTSRQSKLLARRQMQFIAGVSHELLTPLSVIRTAAANISRGLVNDSEKALEYGKTLDRESRRLYKMVEQVLGFAAIQSGVRRRELEPVDVGHLTHEILSEYRNSLEQQGWEISEDIEPVGRARIDRRGLETCLSNLIDNAAKYADTGRWLRVTACRKSDTSKPVVRITVEDHGPGIAPEDLRHVFKAFYRGRGLAASNVPGAGLGLSIVRQQLRNLGGDVSVVSTAQGCAFSVVIPAAD